jgi:RNA polymerase sigma-70 factor (ECF subfamily)
MISTTGQKASEPLTDPSSTRPAGSGPSPLRGEQAALVVRLRMGDEAAYDQLVRENSGAMLTVARRLLQDDDAARDAVQDAFMNAFRSMPTFREDASLSTWLHRIVVNAALMHLRRVGRRPEASIDDLLPVFDETGHHRSLIEPHPISVETALSQKDTRRAVRTCIDRLPASYRTVLMLRDIEELSTAETAELLHISENAVKTRLHRARQALATLLRGVLAVPDTTSRTD